MSEKFDYKVYNWSIEDGDYERIEEKISVSTKIKEYILHDVGFLFFLLIFVFASIFILSFSI